MLLSSTSATWDSCLSLLRVCARNAVPWSLTNQQLQTGQVTLCCSIVGRKSTAVCFHFCSIPMRQQPVDSFHPAEPCSEMERRGPTRILILNTCKQIRIDINNNSLFNDFFPSHTNDFILLYIYFYTWIIHLKKKKKMLKNTLKMPLFILDYIIH